MKKDTRYTKKMSIRPGPHYIILHVGPIYLGGTNPTETFLNKTYLFLLIMQQFNKTFDISYRIPSDINKFIITILKKLILPTCLSNIKEKVKKITYCNLKCSNIFVMYGDSEQNQFSRKCSNCNKICCKNCIYVCISTPLYRNKDVKDYLCKICKNK